MAITERNPDGTIKSSKLSSAEAKRIGSMPKGKKEKLKSVEQILVDDGYPEPTEAPERKRLMAEQAAKGNVTAIKYFSTKEDAKAVSVTANVQAGQVCPTCQQYVLVDLQLEDTQAESVQAMIDAYRGQVN